MSDISACSKIYFVESKSQNEHLLEHGTERFLNGMKKGCLLCRNKSQFLNEEEFSSIRSNRIERGSMNGQYTAQGHKTISAIEFPLRLPFRNAVHDSYTFVNHLCFNIVPKIC